MKASIYIPVKGERIEITERRCSDKVQPHIKLKTQMIVQDVNRLKSGPVQIVATLNNKTYKVNSDRFGWRLVHPAEKYKELLDQVEEMEDRALSNALNYKEKVQVAMIPFVIIHIIWFYAMKTIKLAGKNKVQILKEYTSETKTLHKKFQYQMDDEWDIKDKYEIQKEADSFIEKFQQEFSVMFYTINSLFIKIYPKYPFSEMRSYALMTMVLIQCYEEHSFNMDKIINTKCYEKRQSILPEGLRKLYICMEAISADLGKFNFSNSNVILTKKIFLNNISQCDVKLLEPKKTKS